MLTSLDDFREAYRKPIAQKCPRCGLELHCDCEEEDYEDQKTK